MQTHTHTPITHTHTPTTHTHTLHNTLPPPSSAVHDVQTYASGLSPVYMRELQSISVTFKASVSCPSPPPKVFGLPLFCTESCTQHVHTRLLSFPLPFASSCWHPAADGCQREREGAKHAGSFSRGQLQMSQECRPVGINHHPIGPCPS